ncbi:hypothetical protein M0657_008810 [Pyricularia oryzae]|nr:hypothetical protein M0657_008810 [Pyricularia oryzae]
MSLYLDEYWCSLPPPTPRLWRVLQDTTQSYEDPVGNILARGSQPQMPGSAEESEDKGGDASSNSDVHNRVAEEQRLLDANLELESLSGAVANLNICGAGTLAASVDAAEELDEPHDRETSENEAQETKKSSLPIEGPVGAKLLHTLN